jgi:hypothetical protein
MSKKAPPEAQEPWPEGMAQSCTVLPSNSGSGRRLNTNVGIQAGRASGKK